MIQKNKFIIIGAGVSGMQAASFLHENGHEVQILEARTKYGGRVCSNYDFADFPIEFGGEEVHGENSQHYHIAVENNVEMINEDDRAHYVEIDGEVRNCNEVLEDPEYERGLKITSEILNYCDDQDMSVFDYLKKSNVSEKVWHVCEALVAREWGTSLDKISMKSLSNFFQSYSFGSKNFFIQNTSQMQLFERKFKNIMDKIQLNTPVTSINYKGKQVIVTDANNKVYKADKVIVTVPISILKKEYIKFVPELDDKRKSAIQALDMDSGAKLIMKFSHRFWNDDLVMLSLKGHLGLLWSPSNNNSSQTSHVMTSLLTGEHARKIGSMSKDEVQSLIFEELGKVYGPIVEKAYMDHVLIDWSKEEFIEGAYTYPTMQETNNNHREHLMKNIERKLFFAGEAINKVNHSTIGAALGSGLRVANEIQSMCLMPRL